MINLDLSFKAIFYTDTETGKFITHILKIKQQTVYYFSYFGSITTYFSLFSI